MTASDEHVNLNIASKMSEHSTSGCNVKILYPRRDEEIERE